ncbi:MAG TPA: fatty acid desaturase [Chitinophagales bacterium]|nr:fatty acid desaturase [Chitinophagales bacterium]
MIPRRNGILLVETFTILILNGVLATYMHSHLPTTLFRCCYAPLLLFQGLWYYRIYIVGHEAAHKKLIPAHLLLNEIAGSLVLLPLLTPLNIYRKIHYFHHGFNRKDPHTSALDTFVVKGKYRTLKTAYYYVVWYLSVFCGGFFLHSLVSVILFLFCPPALARKISPAFNGWNYKDQLKAILLFLAGILIHLWVFTFFGKTAYLLSLGLPMLVFAWLLSMLVYVFHYDTTMGEHVRYNVRSVNRIPVLSWILMNFNEHATHHQYPNIPWYRLPENRSELPEEFGNKNQSTRNFFVAVIRQLKGPHVIYQP